MINLTSKSKIIYRQIWLFWTQILWKHYCSLAPIFVVSSKCIDPHVLEFRVSNTTCNNQWKDCISLHFTFCGL